MGMKNEIPGIGQHHVFGEFMELPEWRKALPCHCVYNIKCDGAGSGERFKGR